MHAGIAKDGELHSRNRLILTDQVLVVLIIVLVLWSRLGGIFKQGPPPLVCL